METPVCGKRESTFSTLYVSEPHTFVFSIGAERKGYHNAAATSEVVLGDNFEDHIVTFQSFSRRRIAEDKPLTPAPTTRQCPLLTLPREPRML